MEVSVGTTRDSATLSWSQLPDFTIVVNFSNLRSLKAEDIEFSIGQKMWTQVHKALRYKDT